MKKTLFLSLMLAAVVSLWAQQPLKVETYHLDNGLKVILCEEHSQPKVYGCVMVHAGSKNEDPNFTGVAHYFEHIMFKGTDQIGTINWKAEKVYLDSISDAYDRLHATKNPAERQAIQLEINRLNIAASKYAIPNEVDAILQKMGCTGLNAGTSYDYTVYYNTLPSNQLNNWMDVYVERFRRPIFRLFQSELEAVYEEKNMYENQMGYDFRTNIFKEAFGEHPYSRDVIGLGEHLKNPQPSKMEEFFQKYYVANNMVLILVGDFNTAETKKLIAQKFSTWRSAPLPQQPAYKLPTFDQQRIVEVNQTPIKMGIINFPGVKNSDPDCLPLGMLASILGGGSGLLDKAVTDGRLFAAELMPLELEDAGTNVVLYVPNLIGQSHEAAEQIVWDCIDSIKQGAFSDELLQSVKNSALVDLQRRIEDISSISQLLLQLEMEGSSYEQWLRDGERWKNLTRDEIIEVANKYFNRNHCTIVRSKMGFPKHDEAVKPAWDHLEAQNQGEQSVFAKMIFASQPDPIQPQRIDFEKDVAITQLSPSTKLYSVNNPKNGLFELKLHYNYGVLDDPNLPYADQYMSAVGAAGMDPQQLNQLLDQFGGSVYFSAGMSSSAIVISGLEENIDTILSIATEMMFNPTHDSKQIGKLVEGIKTEKKASKSSSDEWFDALSEIVSYGQQSRALNRMSYKELASCTGESLHAKVLKIFGRNGHATFVGNTSPEDLCAKIRQHGLVRDDVEVVGFRDRKELSAPNSRIIYAHNKKFLQSDIAFMQTSIDFDTADVAVANLYNEYFGSGMNSVVFQEIREFRSLGYSTYGHFRCDTRNLNPAMQYCFLGTQCDKTNDGVQAMKDLMVNFPVRPDKFAPAVEHQVTARNSSYLTFRNLPDFVFNAMEHEGWKTDRRAEITNKISKLTIEDLQAFHAKYIKGRPITVVISGNAKRFKVKELANILGPGTTITEYKYNQLFKF